MSYNFNLYVTNKFSKGNITLSGDITGTAPTKPETTYFDHEQSRQTCTIYFEVPSDETVEAPTKFKIDITNGNYILSTKNHKNFELKITNNSESTTNVTIGDNQ